MHTENFSIRKSLTQKILGTCDVYYEHIMYRITVHAGLRKKKEDEQFYLSFNCSDLVCHLLQIHIAITTAD